MSGITYIVDSSGKRQSAVLDLRRYGQLWEDIYDTILAESRAHEPRESLEFVKKRLKLVKERG